MNGIKANVTIDIKVNARIYNLPDYATKKDYIVATVAEDGQLWFYGAYDDTESEMKAARCALEERPGGRIMLKVDKEGN